MMFTISVFILLVISLSAKSQEILNLQQIGNLLGYPSDELVIEDYLEKEKSAYIQKTVIEKIRNIPSPFPADQIYKAYKITGKDPSTFLPIVITVVARESYRSDFLVKLENQLKTLDETPISQGGRLPYGSFKISKNTNGFFCMMPETRVPSQTIHLDHDPPGVDSYLDNYPDKEPCLVSFMSVPESNVDVRISQYINVENRSQKLNPIFRGEKYFNRFGYQNEENLMNGETFKPDELPHTMILEIFRSLNIEILKSPILNSFRKDQKPSVPVIAPNIAVPAQPIITEETKTRPAETPSAISSPLPKEKSWLWLWVIASLAALSLIILSVKRLKAKRS